MSEIERLREVLFELEQAKVREEERRQESEALLAGLRALSEPNQPEKVFVEMLKAVRSVLDWAQAFVLSGKEGQPLSPVVATHPHLAHTLWPQGELFARVLRGEPVALFDVRQSPEWMQQPAPVLQGVTSALHVRLGTGQLPTMLVCTHPQRGKFGRAQIQLARRLAPLASQALVNLELRQTTLERDQFFTLTQDLMCVLEGDGGFRQLNPSWEHVLGFQENDIRARNFVAFAHPEDRGRVQAALESVRQGNHPPSIDARLECRDGTFRWIAWTFSAAVQQDACFVAGHDFTERAKLEEQLLQSHKLEAVGRLAGGVAHDMNNLLGAINTLASLIDLEIPPDSPIAQDVAEIRAACRRGRDLTTNLLGFARKGTYLRELLSLNDIVRSVVTLLERTVAKKVLIQTELSPELPLVAADSTQLTHAIMNLCLNAVDALSDGGTLRLVTERVEPSALPASDKSGTKDAAAARLRVIDTGVGMTDDVAARALEPFFSTKPLGKGTGLGLPMVYGTVRNLGGTLALDSTVGRGTTVTIDLPAYTGGPLRKLVQKPPVPALQSEKVLVLVIDDEAMVRNSVSRLLQSAGHRVLVAENGEQGIEIYRQHGEEIAVVLLDQIMPGLNGEQTLCALLRINPEVRVVALSGYASEGRADVLKSLGAKGFIQKPFEATTLLNAVACAARARSGSPSPPPP